MAGKLDHLRNVALIGHSGAGKTSVAEAMLFAAKATTRLGKVDDGSSVLDFEAEEVKRRISIAAACHHFDWKKHAVHFVDTPGDDNFLAETRAALQVADSALVIIDAVDGVKVGTEKVWAYADKHNLPRLIFVNKMERERADFTKAVQEAGSILKAKPVLLQIPMGQEANFKGVVDLVTLKAYTFDNTGKATEVPIPADLQEEAEAQRSELYNFAAETDDALIEKFLEEGQLTQEEVLQGLRAGVLAGSFVPVLCGAASQNLAISLLLDAINTYLPSPTDRGPVKGFDPKSKAEISREADPDGPFCAYVFKTVADPYAGRLSVFRIYSGTVKSDSSFYNANKETSERFGQLFLPEGKNQKSVESAGPGTFAAVAKLKDTVTGDTLCQEAKPIILPAPEAPKTVVTFAVEPKSRGDEDKVYSSITRLIEEDPSLAQGRNAETKEILLSGMGQVHIEATVEKMKRKFGVEVNLKTPKVPYRETIKGRTKIQGKYKRQSGGRGQFGDTWLEIEPLPRGGGFEFVDKIVGGAIPKQYIPAVEKGIVEAMLEGEYAGCPVVDVKITLYDGSFHDVDSSEMAFKIAGSMGFKKGFMNCQPTLLEPVMLMQVTVPEEFMGDIIGDLNGRRGRVLGVDSEGSLQIIKANVPLSEVQHYQPDLTSKTGGRGTYEMEFSHYEEVPPAQAEKVIVQLKAEKEKE